MNTMNFAEIIAGVAMITECHAMLASEAKKHGNLPSWYYPKWLADAPFLPIFQVRDTVNKYGRYAAKPKIITVKDLIKFHGHFCGGVVEATTTLQVAFNALFPEGVIDRTDLRIASNNSACGGDVASYLTGARTRFRSHYIDKQLGASEFVVQHISTAKTVRVSINQSTYPTEVRKQMRKIESGNFAPEDIDLFQQLQWDYGKLLVSRPQIESVDIIKDPDYTWPAPPCTDLGRRKDNDYKDIPA